MAADRAVSTTVGYAMTLTITTLLVTGLLIAGGDFVSTQRDGAARNELRVLGQQLAADVAAADRLGRNSGPDGDLTLSRSLPGQITGATYAINVSRVGNRNTYELFLESADLDQSSTVRVYSTTPLFTRGNISGGDVDVEYNSVTEQLAVKRPGPYVFPEESGMVVIEAESLPRDEAGTGEFATHFWKAFEDGDASGGEALATYPNVSDSGGTNDTKDGPRLDYEVDLETTGPYYVFVRMRAPSDGSSGESNSVHVGVNGTMLSGGGRGLGGSTGWNWENTVEGTGTTVSFTVSSPGRHTLNVWMREDGTQIDKIVLKPTNTAPGGTGPPESDWQ